MKNQIKNILKGAYADLSPFSDVYGQDFCRFLKALEFLSEDFDFKEKKVLDLGSGIGIMALAMKKMGADVTGIDQFIFPDEKENFYTVKDFSVLEKIWRDNGLSVIKKDVEKPPLPFSPDSFDLVICDATIEHLINSPKNIFEEARRILRLGGLFFVSTPNLASFEKRLRFALGLSPNWDVRDFYSKGENFRGHRREFTLKEVREMAEISSFEFLKGKTENVFLNYRRLLNPNKFFSQVFILISYLVPAGKDMIFFLSRKKEVR